jgi:hypothetical protein
VLVHCEEGISRASAWDEPKNGNNETKKGYCEAKSCGEAEPSAESTAEPLKPKLSYREAFDHVLKVRPTAAPNLAFVVALTVWERQSSPGGEHASEVEALTGVLDHLSLDSHV